ncbi:winged helix-turn-helix domain-containing protein [Natrinema sp. 1APR25-10V2]|uniref:winged helix-turn-helix domain-containing protein n=1 Tax=Natrinema sp. 1APR25-10V2 TaxID=2951081 RepID=UPI00287670A8|nr:winged helix-turn-helix domain-containing protein [Natrinema sp. 1APR25-10V2]MDS0478452.1 winged helix-turn-helix domain-containing protein [Natrinema sp. 1APR25-10V2]
MTEPRRDDAGEGEETSDDEESRERRAPADAFAALSDPLRVSILRELSVHHRTSDEAAIGFADLRRRVGVRDSGRFRYHLNELRDGFVEKGDGGYRLTHAGVQVVAAILAGTYTAAVSMGPTELESDCPVCGRPAVATCEDGRCRVTCENDHALFQWSVPPNATADATLPAVVDLAELLAFQAIEQSLAGVCPQCYDPIETEIVVDGAPHPIFRAVCDTCGAQIVGPASFCLLVDPDVTAFCRRHGLTLREDHVWELPFVRDDEAVTVVDEEPLRLAFDIPLEGESMSVTVDARGHVTAVETAGDE